MLDTPTQHQRQLWVVARLYRICSTFRSLVSGEPCLEQYETQVQLMTGQEITPAASAWIQVIAETLRDGREFCPEELITE